MENITQNELVSNYIIYVKEQIDKYTKYSRLICNDQVHPDDLNSALANYLPINSMLLAEYQRVKVELFQINNNFEAWWDSKFVETRNKLISQTDNKNLKTSLKEIETILKVDCKIEYAEWQNKLKEAELKVSFLRRYVELYKNFQNILIALSQNMRQEMRILKTEDKMNFDENKVRKLDEDNKLRRRE